MSNEIFEIGKNYLIRTVTFAYTGKLTKQDNEFLVLEKAAWIADTGGFYDALKNGSLGEIEPYIADVIIAKGAIVDATIWGHKLPDTQKNNRDIAISGVWGF